MTEDGFIEAARGVNPLVGEKDMTIQDQERRINELKHRLAAAEADAERLRQGQCSTPGCENKGHRYLCESCIDALRNLSAEAATLREELDRVRTEEGRADAYWGEKEDRIRAEQQRDAALDALEGAMRDLTIAHEQEVARAKEENYTATTMYAVMAAKCEAVLKAAGRTGNDKDATVQLTTREKDK